MACHLNDSPKQPLMNIILGASGRVGNTIVNHLLDKRVPVKAVVRNADKAAALAARGAIIAVADVENEPALRDALADGTTVFLLTPESGQTENLLEDAQRVLQNYKQAIAASPIDKIVGLSSMGAQHKHGTGNLLMSYALEHAFTDLERVQIFIRPAYYYSNWLQGWEMAKAQGVLPTFFPVDLKIPMIAPSDVGAFAADVIASRENMPRIYEIRGPESLSSGDVAQAMSEALGKPVQAVETPRDQWATVLAQGGFTPDGIRNFIEMTDAVIEGKAKAEVGYNDEITTATTFREYLQNPG